MTSSRLYQPVASILIMLALLMAAMPPVRCQLASNAFLTLTR